MPIPKWFYIVIAACAVVLTASTVSYRIHTWTRWEHITDGVFNPDTGIGCYLSGYEPTRDTAFCIDLTNGHIRRYSRVVPIPKPN